MKYYLIAGLLLIAGLTLSIRQQSSAINTASATSFPVQQNNLCEQLAQLPYTAMNARQWQLANECDQQQASREWQATYGSISSQDILNAAINEPS